MGEEDEEDSKCTRDDGGGPNRVEDKKRQEKQRIWERVRGERRRSG